MPSASIRQSPRIVERSFIWDTSFTLDHPNLPNGTKIVHWAYQNGKSVTSRDDAKADEKVLLGKDHCVACAGVIGVIGVIGKRTLGVAPRCALVLMNATLVRGSNDDITTADSKMAEVLNYLAKRVDVISLSLVPRLPSKFPESRVLWGAAVVQRIAELSRVGGPRGKGILFVWAAGNDNIPIDFLSPIDLPLAAEGKKPTRRDREFSNSLTELEGVIRVAAITDEGRRAHYSNWGPDIDLCAPSGNRDTYGRWNLKGTGITTSAWQKEPDGHRIEVTRGFDGTSASAPIVAGVAALVIEANPCLSAFEVAEILRRTACKDKDFIFDKDPVSDVSDHDPNRSRWDTSPAAPYDRGDFREIGSPDGIWSPWFGYGRVNALAAVQEALRRKKCE
ncbi:MAG: S8 family serine peptidase [Panacagrimonas sp.]